MGRYYAVLSIHHVEVTRCMCMYPYKTRQYATLTHGYDIVLLLDIRGHERVG